MSAITISSRGDFHKTIKYLNKLKKREYLRKLDKYGKAGVDALQRATPVDSGKTADSWDYDISQTSSGTQITWTNSNINNGVNIAVILQYGHGTGTGGYVQGRDYINPAMRPVFDKIANEAWKAVTNG